jgi:predicted small lipoprotein YifL
MVIKKRLVLFLLLVIAVVQLTGCGTKNKMDFYDGTKSTDLSQEKIGAVSVGSDESKVREEFGEPDSINRDKNSTHLIYGEKLEFKVTNGVVERYLISNNQYKTEKNIYRGSSKEDVVRAYGDHNYKRTDTGAEVIGYFDKTNKLNIEFTIDEQVVGILVSDISKEIKE